MASLDAMTSRCCEETMKRLKLLLVVCVCVLMPVAARADDGGWLDWLYRLDTKLVGVGSEIHVLCLKENKERVENCEQWWWGLRRVLRGKLPSPYPVNVSDIKHELDFRFAFYWKYGSRFSDVVDDRAVHAWKLMGMYHYRLNSKWDIGAGAGVIPFTGEGFDGVWRAIITPVSVVWAPLKTTRGGLIVRPELSIITGDLNGPVFGNPVTRFSKSNEANVSVAIGWEFRRQ
jgi:hypothetical protein